MTNIAFVPRVQQMRQFIEACEGEPPADRTQLFKSHLRLSDAEFRFLLFNGMLSPESSLDTFGCALRQIEIAGIQPLIQKTLADVSRDYPTGEDLCVELYPMDRDDGFGIERLRGVSAWTNWEGTTLQMVVYPSEDTIQALRATVVHEYNHHYRIAALGNGHPNITLLEKIIREGLAEHFVDEILGADSLGPWVNALTECDARRYWAALYARHANDTGERTDSLVFGGGHTDLPLWAGYSMGYYLVKWYRELNPLTSITDLTKRDCREFIPSRVALLPYFDLY